MFLILLEDNLFIVTIVITINKKICILLTDLICI